MKKWKCVAWYSCDPRNEHVAPTALVEIIEADTESEAYDKALDRMDEVENANLWMKTNNINYYVFEFKE